MNINKRLLYEIIKYFYLPPTAVLLGKLDTYLEKSNNEHINIAHQGAKNKQFITANRQTFAK